MGIAPITLLTARKISSKLGPLHEWLLRFPGRRYFISEKPLQDTRHYFRYIQKNIDQINEYAKNSLNADFRLFVFPRSYQYSDKECPLSWEKDEYENLGPHALEPFVYFEELAKSAVDYPIFPLLPAFQNSDVFPTTFENDPHWNRAGNVIATNAIYNYLMEESIQNKQ